MPAFKIPEIKRSRTGNNLCQCLVEIDLDAGEAEIHYQHGCGAHCSNRFAQGHDAKLKSAIIRAHRLGMTMEIHSGDDYVFSTQPKDLARQLGWEEFVTDGKPKSKGPRKPVVEPGIRVLDEIGQELSVGCLVEFKHRGKQTQATIQHISENGVLSLTWISTASGKEMGPFMVESTRAVLVGEGDA